ncbi:uncharacterized protein LOC125177936 [Hyalella azteca]|uniref:Uncharacterized protein LOC125177936 n=1 Tax=Hyalella azteca TaxID=294128 RepID=A0A979FJ96_HYAAZ|nr:uncharacterized protein LOC125177936 [Hyalella azteca]
MFQSLPISSHHQAMHLPCPTSQSNFIQHPLGCHRKSSLPYSNASEIPEHVEPKVIYTCSNQECSDMAITEDSNDQTEVADDIVKPSKSHARSHSAAYNTRSFSPPAFMSLPFTFTDTRAVEVTVDTNASSVPSTSTTSNLKDVLSASGLCTAQNAQKLSVPGPDQHSMSLTVVEHNSLQRMKSAPDSTWRPWKGSFKRKSLRKSKHKSDRADLQLEMLPFKISDPDGEDITMGRPNPQRLNSSPACVNNWSPLENPLQRSVTCKPKRISASPSTCPRSSDAPDKEPKSVLMSPKPTFRFSLDPPRRDTL